MKPLTGLMCLAFVFVCATSVLYLVSLLITYNDTNSKYKLQFPTNLDDLKGIAHILQDIKDQQKAYVILLFSTAYMYKQTFAIPGSVFLNLLAGALFGLWRSFALTCFLTACGATCCYLLSRMFGKPILFHYFPDKFNELEKKVCENQDGMFFFLVCLRLFPMSPNWFLNISSPVIGIPILYFFPSVFVGLMPYNFICCQTGEMLAEISSVNDILTVSVMVKLALIAIIVALPGILVKQWNKHNCDCLKSR